MLAAMRQVNMHEAKTHLSRLVRVTALDDASNAAPERRRLGLLQGQCDVPDDFDHMAAGEIADLFEGSGLGG